VRPPSAVRLGWRVERGVDVRVCGLKELGGKIMLRSFFALGGFDRVLGCLRLSTDLHGCARILFGGFWIVIGTVMMRD
jgi:hypothetical protein